MESHPVAYVSYLPCLYMFSFVQGPLSCNIHQPFYLCYLHSLPHPLSLSLLYMSIFFEELQVNEIPFYMPNLQSKKSFKFFKPVTLIDVDYTNLQLVHPSVTKICDQQGTNEERQSGEGEKGEGHKKDGER